MSVPHIFIIIIIINICSLYKWPVLRYDPLQVENERAKLEIIHNNYTRLIEAKKSENDRDYGTHCCRRPARD